MCGVRDVRHHMVMVGMFLQKRATFLLVGGMARPIQNSAGYKK